MLMKKENINPICSGQKWITLRKPDFKIIPGKDHKLMNNFGKPYFAEVFIEYTFMYDIRCMTDEFAYICWVLILLKIIWLKDTMQMKALCEKLLYGVMFV